MGPNSLMLTVINKILESNEGSRKLLIAFAKKSFCIKYCGICITALIDIDGFLTEIANNNYDVIIEIKPSSIDYLLHKDRIALLRSINFVGDKSFGMSLLSILTNIHYYGLYLITSYPLLNLFFSKLTQAISIIADYMKLLTNSFSISTSEYLLYETQDLITRYENDQLWTEIEDLNSRVDHLGENIRLIDK